MTIDRLASSYLDRAREISGQIVGWRRHIHQHPELGFQEIGTAQYVAAALQSLGLSPKTGVGKTGVTADLGPEGGPIVAIRADMDALPVQEQSGVEYCSLNPGKMHACGHDSHVAMALGAAAILKDQPLAGRVRFIFQPAEEMEDDEGMSGAERMAADGVMDGVSAIIGQHVEPSLPAGSVGAAPGPFAAAPDNFHAYIRGQGTHAAYPHAGLDTIWLASQVLNAIYAIRDRLVKPSIPALITVGIIQGGTAHNVIPPQVQISGTIRTFDQASRERMYQALHQACSIARTFGGDYDLTIIPGCPPVSNDPVVTALVREEALALFGSPAVIGQEPQCGGDDFSIFSTMVPGCYWSLGSTRPGNDYFECHDPRFRLDEDIFPVGTALLAASAERLLRHFAGA
ncbi:MAG: amidohydrolase [Chloroflexi bacterium]|nr:amidohydrolase [Chloroflexota bacterium]OJV88992.1 MAG: hypothetical protein BGO39_32845 [Chloroflexi bacterium 54-19]